MRVFHSFADLGAAFGVSQKDHKTKDFHCRKCGGVMRHIPETNVFLCENESEDGVVCGHRVLTLRAF